MRNSAINAGKRGSFVSGRGGRQSLLEGSGAQSFRSKVIISSSSADMKQMESVIYTAVIPRGPGDDQLVIVTTKRVVVGEYKREKGWAWVDVIWQCELTAIQPPVMERSGGGTVSLLLKGYVSRSFSRVGLVETSESITADYHVLVNLSNCLHTILYDFDVLLPYAGSDTWLEDAQGIIRIGSWQYHRPEPLSSDHRVDKSLQEKLEMCKWVKPPHATDDGHVPRWLSEARSRAVNAHGEVKALTDLAADLDSSNSNPTIQMCKDKLRQGHMTGAEFKLFMERELQYGKSMKPETSSEDSATPEEEKKFLGRLKVPKNVVRFAHKIKGVVGSKRNKLLQEHEGEHASTSKLDSSALLLPDKSATLQLEQHHQLQHEYEMQRQEKEEEEEKKQEEEEPRLQLFSSSRPLKIENVFVDDESDDSNSDSESESESKSHIRGAAENTRSFDESNESLFQSSDEDEDEDARRGVSVVHTNVAISSQSRKGFETTTG
jgi:hypothetical protein